MMLAAILMMTLQVAGQDAGIATEQHSESSPAIAYPEAIRGPVTRYVSCLSARENALVQAANQTDKPVTSGARLRPLLSSAIAECTREREAAARDADHLLAPEHQTAAQRAKVIEDALLAIDRSQFDAADRLDMAAAPKAIVRTEIVRESFELDPPMGHETAAYGNCLAASAGSLPAGLAPAVERGGDCAPFRERARLERLAQLEGRGLSAQARAEHAEADLRQLEAFLHKAHSGPKAKGSSEHPHP